MFRKTTTFVLGAGASKEFSLPTGHDLKTQIADACRFRFEYGNRQTSGDSYILFKLREKFDVEDVNKFTKGGNQLSESIPLFPSIDEAIHYHSVDEKIVFLGKLAIAKFILEAEQECNLTKLDNPYEDVLDSTQGTWLWEFLSIAISGLTQDNYQDIFKNVKIINFNYDRTVEHYLYWALQRKAGISAENAKEAVSGLKSIHPYGSLGPLDWQGNGMAFGGNGDLFSLAEKIRTFTEQIDDDLVNQIAATIIESNLVIFLGFGFHGQNIGLFQLPDNQNDAGRNVWATVYGIDDENSDMIGQALEPLCNASKPRLFNWKANEFLSNFRQSISAKVG